MANPYTTPTPPTPRPPDTRPLRKRAQVWIGGSGLFIAGALIAATGNGGQEPVEARVEPATTITATVTATPEPGPTVTETVKAKAQPRPTVTVTTTAAAVAADSGSDSDSDGGGQDSTGTCSIVSNSGNCYSAGQFCRNSDHGADTTTADGTKIKCAYSSNAWRWTYI
ncbi:hypothetical protein [Streptomyces sp. NBC_00878]|uniref:hypothetical protein n=1 Tax=Streptomyces sp. NBC_00878 TaxID=2975854 RepID=UPI002256E13A|nr:hypothetical protein [Streptomyces sp. NBC_00878]MCX4910963.1 hypothetical protein [Streptomyces sp. NBC_00878]